MQRGVIYLKINVFLSHPCVVIHPPTNDHTTCVTHAGNYCMNMHPKRSILYLHIYVFILARPSHFFTSMYSYIYIHTHTNKDNMRDTCLTHACIHCKHTKHTQNSTHTMLTCSHSRIQESNTPKTFCEEYCNEDKKAAVLEVLRKSGAS